MRRVFFLLLLFTCAWPVNAQPHADRWNDAVDAFWPRTLTTEQQLDVFDAYWNAADQTFAAFHNLDLDWNTLRDRYRPEIVAGVSRGRFAGIMNHLALALREQHSYVVDSLVNVETALRHGVPLMLAGGWWSEKHFGACLTLTPDSTLVVYDAVPNHPLDLAPGDVVLGYDGVPWSRAYRMMLEAELPIAEGRLADGRNSSWGSAPTAFEHSWMISAGRNWHLFDEVDVVPYGGDTLHLPVTSLEGLTDSLLCMEQLPVPGVGMPDLDQSEFISWGVIEGTRIGYVYSWGWFNPYRSSYWQPDAPRIEEAFAEAVRELAVDMETDGIIFDFRTNRGGLAHNPNDGFSILFDEIVPTLGADVRSSPDDHYAMEEGYGIPFLDIPGDAATFYDRPIAILTGPGAFSAGDYTPVRLAYHPHVRIFGKSTAAAFSPGARVDFSVPEWSGAVSFLEAYRKENPGQYLTHTEQRVDVPVWHTREAIAEGRDNVVEAAVAWITHVRAGTENGVAPTGNTLGQNYPNPSRLATTIELRLAAASPTTLHVYDVLGRRVLTVVDAPLAPGTHSFVLDTSRFAPGIYVYTVRAGDYTATRRMQIVR